MTHKSKRFSSDAWIARLAPAILVVLLLALLLTLVVIGLSILGLTPSF